VQHDTAAHERIVKLEGISPGMTSGAMALMPDAPLLTALSTKSGAASGGTSVWIQGSRFNTRTRVYVGGALAARMTVVSDGLITITTPPAQPGAATVELRATNDSSAWSNALHFSYEADGSLGEGASMETALLQRQISLLQQFVLTCCGGPSGEALVADLMLPSLPEPQRLFGAVLSLIHAGSGGAGGSLDLGAQDAHGCTLMHYVCALRNTPALQLLLNSNVDPRAIDAQGQTAADWARRNGFSEGEALIARVTGDAAPPAGVPPLQPTAASAVAPPVVPLEVEALVPEATAVAPQAASSATRSLEQFLEPTPAVEASPMETEAPAAQPHPLAGFLTAAAAHVDQAPPN